MKFHCKYDALVDPKTLKLHEDNTNIHPDEQLNLLGNIIEARGWRKAIIISKQTDQVTHGNGVTMAALKKDWKEVPVVYQDYESYEEEYITATSDNSISSWSYLDMAKINADLPNLGPNLDLSLLGIKDLVLDMSEIQPGSLEDQGKLDELQPKMYECYHCKETIDIRNAKKIG